MGYKTFGWENLPIWNNCRLRGGPAENLENKMKAAGLRRNILNAENSWIRRRKIQTLVTNEITKKHEHACVLSSSRRITG